MVVGAQYQFQAAKPGAQGGQGVRVAGGVVGKGSQFPDGLRDVFGAAVADGGDGQGAFFGGEGGDIFAGGGYLLGVSGGVAGHPLDQFQQRQAGKGIGRVRRRSRAGQLRFGQAGNDRAQAVVSGFEVFNVLLQAFLPAGERGQQILLAGGDALEGVNETFSVEVQQDFPDGPAGAEKGGVGIQSGQGLA